MSGTFGVSLDKFWQKVYPCIKLSHLNGVRGLMPKYVEAFLFV